MANFQQLQKNLVGALSKAPEGTEVDSTSALFALIDAWPYWGDPAFEAVHRATLVNLMLANMPNAPIGTSYFADSYTGTFSGYQSYFFQGSSLSKAADKVRSEVEAVNPACNATWWGGGSVMLLTDQIQASLSVPQMVHTDKLATDIGNFNTALKPCLAATYLGVFESGFVPTANALAKVPSSGEPAWSVLAKLITQGQFTAAINNALAGGGDGAEAAGWFLFNLWITLKALGAPDVDALIAQFQSAGLTIPSQLEKSTWWDGGYISWFSPLAGAEFSSLQGLITADMPVETVNYRGAKYYHNLAGGYGLCFLVWCPYETYNSCFGPGTGVLMCDGSTQPIEEVEIGNQVWSTSGPVRVVLVEKLPRAKRPLYCLNELKLYHTASHPFRAADSTIRYAVEPWSLADSAPTFIHDGIGILRAGVKLAGRDAAQLQTVTVSKVESQPATPDTDGWVYDLVLERSDSVPAYFVGGPNIFLATDAETSDNYREPATTAVIATALASAVEQYRANAASDPLIHLRQNVSLTQISTDHSRVAAYAGQEPEPSPHSTPEPGFFLREGQWDLHSSTLGTQLVRRFARIARRETAMGWRASSNPQGCADYLTVVVHDIQFVGEPSAVPDRALDVELLLRGWNAENDTVRHLAASPEPTPYFRYTNSVIEFGRASCDAGPASLIGTLTSDGRIVGTFRSDVRVGPAADMAEHFVFAPNGRIIGRIAIEPRFNLSLDLFWEVQRAQEWTESHTDALAYHLGRQIGDSLNASMRKRRVSSN